MVALVSPLWRWQVTALDGEALTLLDHLASDRFVTPKLNEPLEVVGTVPSDNSEVRRLKDGLPYVAEGVRLLYCFRRDEANLVSLGEPWTIRASTLIMQTTDTAHGEDARTEFTASDPWAYLFHRPVLWEPDEFGPQVLARTGLTYNQTDNPGLTYDQLIIDWLALSTSISTAPFVNVREMFIWLGSGTIETCDFVEDWHVDAGTSIGQAIQDICSAGYCDVWMEPIYDPVGKPGYLCQLNIISQFVDSDGGMDERDGGLGAWRHGTMFAWDRPTQSLMGATDLFDGTERANVIQFYQGTGGRPVTSYTDAASIAIYGDYWDQKDFPTQAAAGVAAEANAKMELALRKTYKQTLTVNPAPERAPEPFVDYQIGDRVRVFVSDNMRQPLPFANATDYVWQRVYGIPVEIDDNGTETVRELIVGPVGLPDAVAPFAPAPGQNKAQSINGQVAVKTASLTQRGGRGTGLIP